MLHFRVGVNAWQDQPLQALRSSNGKWQEAFVETAGGGLEFVLTDGNGTYDKLPDGSNYSIIEAGVYTLTDNQLSAPPDGAPFLVVSDLDGTMVGADATTLRFKQYWEAQAVLRGCRLVFSSGRTLVQYLELAEEKAGLLAQPDVFISAVGTRIYNYDSDGEWEEDAAWTATLDDGWSEQLVRDACTAAVVLCGHDRMHFRPEHEMNQHKITVGVHVHQLRAAEAHITSALSTAAVHAKLITSGMGDWRYLDVVPVGAGKLESLEYVRNRLQIAKERTLACGDSGNDIAMFEGDNLSVVVGNAQPDLTKWLDAAPVSLLADGRPRVYRATAEVADGIMQGLKHFGLY